MEWWKISLLLCGYGLFKEYRPSEPFITPFLTGPAKNFTNEQVYQDIYPIGTYCNLCLLAVVFLLTDFLRYKPVVIIGGLSGVITWSLLAWGTTIPVMQVVEFFYGLFMASEVAYYTYIYAKVDKIHYLKVTSHTRTAFLLGKASAGLSSQLFVMYNVLDYLQLNYVTVGGLATATILAILLPSVPQSVYFHRRAGGAKNPITGNMRELEHPTSGDDGAETESDGAVVLHSSAKQQCHNAFSFLYQDFIHAFTNSYVLKWSIWWALATCGYLQVTSYSQSLWEDINIQDKKGLYNGFVEFCYSLLASAISFSVGFLNLKWERWGELTLGILTFIQGGCLLYSAYLANLYLAYAVYMLYGVLYQAAITIASAEVAKYIKEDSYALVFGINTFLAVLVQTVLTLVVIDHLDCPIRTQFQVYGGYHFVIGGGFLLAGLLTLSNKSVRRILKS